MARATLPPEVGGSVFLLDHFHGVGVGGAAVGEMTTVGLIAGVAVGTTGGAAVATTGGRVGAGADGCGAALPKTTMLPSTMLSAMTAVRAKFIAFARDHFLERPFGRRDFFGITPSSRFCEVDYSTDVQKTNDAIIGRCRTPS